MKLNIRSVKKGLTPAERTQLWREERKHTGYSRLQLFLTKEEKEEVMKLYYALLAKRGKTPIIKKIKVEPKPVKKVISMQSFWGK